LDKDFFQIQLVQTADKGDMNDKWEQLLSEFHKLGGIAENVCQEKVECGRGICSINPHRRSRIYTPSRLMIKKDDIYLEGNKIRIKKDREYNQNIRDFFSFYQDNFSWGAGGKVSTEFFEKGLNKFPSELKGLIKKYTSFDLEERHRGNWNEVIKEQFLNSRAAIYAKDSVLVPMFELVNHDVISLSFISTIDGLSTPYYPPFSGELTFSYNNMSALKRFFLYGFFSKETMVFSIPFKLDVKDLGFKLHCKGMNLYNDSINLNRSDNIITIEGLPIADVNHSRLPSYYFDEIIRRVDSVNIPKDILSKIFELNIFVRRKIMEKSYSPANQVSSLLSEIMDYEITLISSYN
tara:strand:- start:353 stop:1402 length:1050 start_codon:yes stop_codon:yes gene_type:complete